MNFLEYYLKFTFCYQIEEKLVVKLKTNHCRWNFMKLYEIIIFNLTAWETSHLISESNEEKLIAISTVNKFFTNIRGLYYTFPRNVPKFVKRTSGTRVEDLPDLRRAIGPQPTDPLEKSSQPFDHASDQVSSSYLKMNFMSQELRFWNKTNEKKFQQLHRMT